MSMPRGLDAMLSMVGGLLMVSPSLVLVGVLLAVSKGTSKQGPYRQPQSVASHGVVSQSVNVKDVPCGVHARAQWDGLWPVVSTGPAGQWTPPQLAPQASVSGAGVAALHQRRRPSIASQRINTHGGENR